VPACEATVSKLLENGGVIQGMPPALRLHIDEIESFQKVRAVDPPSVSHLLSKAGYFDKGEDDIQRALEDILGEPLHKKDWGGETNDLYASNIRLNGVRSTAAFLLKGRGKKKTTMNIGDCGAGGDQIVRLFDSPAQVFFVQFVGTIHENVIRDMEGKVERMRLKGMLAWYCVMNGQDTARLLVAYGKA